MTTPMLLRDGSVVGGARGQLAPEPAAAFAAAVRAVFTRWTALRLAVEGGWGGPDSDAKAGAMAGDVVTWFREGSGKETDGEGEAHWWNERKREVGAAARGKSRNLCHLAHQTHATDLSLTHPPKEHYADELEDELAEAMLSDFGAQLEDESPREVGRREREKCFLQARASGPPALIPLTPSFPSRSSLFTHRSPARSSRSTTSWATPARPPPWPP